MSHLTDDKEMRATDIVDVFAEALEEAAPRTVAKFCELWDPWPDGREIAFPARRSPVADQIELGLLSGLLAETTADGMVVGSLFPSSIGQRLLDRQKMAPQWRNMRSRERSA